MNDFAIAQIKGGVTDLRIIVGMEIYQVAGSQFIVGYGHKPRITGLLAGGVLQFDANLLVAPVCKADTVKFVGAEASVLIGLAQFSACATEKFFDLFALGGAVGQHLKGDGTRYFIIHGHCDVTGAGRVCRNNAIFIDVSNAGVAAGETEASAVAAVKFDFVLADLTDLQRTILGRDGKILLLGSFEDLYLAFDFFLLAAT